MRCKRCFERHGVTKPMLPGKALLPVFGNSSNDHSRGMVMYPIGGAVGTVLKCPECGYSVSNHGMVYGYHEEVTPARTYTVHH